MYLKCLSFKFMNQMSNLKRKVSLRDKDLSDAFNISWWVSLINQKKCNNLMESSSLIKFFWNGTSNLQIRKTLEINFGLPSDFYFNKNKAIPDSNKNTSGLYYILNGNNLEEITASLGKMINMSCFRFLSSLTAKKIALLFKLCNIIEKNI